jgi:hypothetical protein
MAAPPSTRHTSADASVSKTSEPAERPQPGLAVPTGSLDQSKPAPPDAWIATLGAIRTLPPSAGSASSPPCEPLLAGRPAPAAHSRRREFYNARRIAPADVNSDAGPPASSCGRVRSPMRSEPLPSRQARVPDTQPLPPRRTRPPPSAAALMPDSRSGYIRARGRTPLRRPRDPLRSASRSTIGGEPPAHRRTPAANVRMSTRARR